MLVEIRTTPGDVLDRASIIQIKLLRISDPKKLEAVAKAHDMLKHAVELIRWRVSNPYLAELERELLESNSQVWDAEESIRDPDATEPELIEAAIKARDGNEMRNATKRKIDDLCGSAFTEVKSYAA